MRMRRFKLHTGEYPVYELTKENYLTKTKKDKRYSAVGKDQCKRDFAVCPACDNPIQIIGIYKKLENTDKPYGRHYNHDTAIEKHNEQAYQFCPYASNHYDVTRDMKKEKMTDYERDIYRSTRNNFDLAVAILESDLGILVTKNMAEHMLKEYVASKAHMYYWATLYNIPWMLLYFSTSRPCYGLIVKKESSLYQYLIKRKDVRFTPYSFRKGYVRVENNGYFLNLKYTLLDHKRRVVNDEVVEEIWLELYSVNSKGEFDTEYRQKFVINEYRFPNLVAAPKYRRQWLIDLAKNIMPEI